MVALLRVAPYRSGGPVLDALVHQAGAHDLAARTVLAAMTPFMGSQMRWLGRWARTSGVGWTADEVQQCVVATTVVVAGGVSGRRVVWTGARISSGVRKRLHALTRREFERACREVLCDGEPPGRGQAHCPSSGEDRLPTCWSLRSRTASYGPSTRSWCGSPGAWVSSRRTLLNGSGRRVTRCCAAVTALNVASPIGWEAPRIVVG